MVITELKALGSDSYLAVLSEGEAVKVTTAMIADLSIYSGKELSAEALAELRDASRLAGCKKRALRIIGPRPKSCKELYDRLVEKGEEPRDAAACIQWLLDRHYLDDAQYAAMVVRHCAAKGFGVQRVKNELFRRGIDKVLWDEALEEMPDMEDTVYALLCRRLKTDCPDRTELKKATDALYRRGYSWDEIKAAVNRFRNENQNFD